MADTYVRRHTAKVLGESFGAPTRAETAETVGELPT